MNFKEYLDRGEEELNEDVSSEAKDFMKKFNAAVKMLKDELKESDKNDNWKVHLKSIKGMIKY